MYEDAEQRTRRCEKMPTYEKLPSQKNAKHCQLFAASAGSSAASDVSPVVLKGNSSERPSLNPSRFRATSMASHWMRMANIVLSSLYSPRQFCRISTPRLKLSTIFSYF